VAGEGIRPLFFQLGIFFFLPEFENCLVGDRTEGRKDMVISVATPRKSITEKVFQRVGGYYHGSNSGQSHRRCSNESEDDYDEDGTMELVQIGAERTKNGLILMSDTGGGHRASAEAIRDAFQIEFGDEYRVIGLEFLLGSCGFCSICIFPFPLLSLSLSLVFFLFFFC